MPRAGRRQLAKILLGSAIAVALLATLFWLTAPRPRAGGPLAGFLPYEDGVPLRQGEVATWGVVLPANPTLSEIVILAVEPRNATGLEVLGILMHRPDVTGAVGQRYGFPPEGVDTFAPAGSSLPPVGANAQHLEVLIGVRLSDPTSGSIAGLQVRYQYAGVEYVDTLPYSLRVFAPRD